MVDLPDDELEETEPTREGVLPLFPADDAAPKVIAHIAPAPEDAGPDAPPVFKKLNDDYGTHTEPGVRPCEHDAYQFKLDTRWSTVKCGGCGATLDPYQCLLRFREWEARWNRQRDMARQEEHRMVVAHLRTLFRLKSLPDSDRQQIDVVLRAPYRYELKAIRTLVERIDKEERARYWARRKEREDAARAAEGIKDQIAPPTKVIGG